MTNAYAQSTVTVNDLDFSVIDEGHGDAVMLLHGFPDTADMWRSQIDALVDAGYRVIAPDQRGCGRSDRPDGVEQYAYETLLGDVVGIADVLGLGSFSIVGHDWGASLAWALAGFMPDRITRLAALAVPQPEELFPITSVEQARMSYYILMFQHPGVAEAWLRADDWKMFREAWAGGDTDAQIADLSAPGKLESRIDWYRANLTPDSMFLPQPETLPLISIPTLLVYGERDQFLSEEPFLRSEQRCTGPFRYERLDTGHWMPQERPDQVNELLLEFLGAPVPIGAR